ncbi:uncharacterized protein LOC115723620 [Cannabis sativa]|uniref:uncharacterized protein LOC115723620 n=1 Tax=Cannabis sativa TaxID=3483 RepID=UPI0029CA525D|nr:uncharacterized protein LOC115723620 [Cannabis sativa]
MAQGNLGNNPTCLVLQEEESLKQHEFNLAKLKYASYDQELNKVTWLQFGDENSHFFHVLLKKRKLENRITTFVNNGEVIDDYNSVIKHYFSHFKNFLGNKSSATQSISLNCLKFGDILNIQQLVALIRPFTKADVKESLFDIHSNKSLGPDAHGACFYKGLWNEICEEISMDVLNFFQDSIRPRMLNKTVISLIPKNDNPCSTANYRHIACCNTLYKCISKMLCDRLAEVLPFLDQNNQGAFVKN